MVRLLIVLFIVIPAAEVILLIVSSKWIGIVPTFLIMIMTGLIGAYLARKQGLAVLREARDRWRHGQLPADSMLDGICVLLGGILLITPGYVTDLLGLLLLLPYTRRWVKYRSMKWIQSKIKRKTKFIRY